MDKILTGLRARHKEMHPLLFNRCVEKTITNGELFDLLEGMPKEFPIVWDNSSRTWVQTTDLLQESQLIQLTKKKKNAS